MEIEVCGHLAHIHGGGRTPTAETLARQPALLFIHGAQQDHSCWILQSRWFARHGYTVLAPDLPGHGRSAGDPLPSIEALADWAMALLDALGVQRAAVIGHSMGSLVALELAARFPGRIDRLALLGTSLPMPVARALLDACRDDEPRAVEMVNTGSFSAAARFGGSALPGLWLPGLNRRLMQRQKPGVFHVDMAACNAYARPVDSLARLALPVLMLAGSQDRMTPPRAARTLQAQISNARVLDIEGSGHALMAERPDAVLDALITFLDPPAPLASPPSP